ncbi:hypothetical protein HanPSC8_Chr06g0268241 [Helianthus annuus]|nr:hypothetical protein HanPSC8_Chr06g0268241 [Helianthus annuus]
MQNHNLLSLQVFDDLSVGLVNSLSAGQAAPISGLTASSNPLKNRSVFRP